jgi:hypothetical protein
MIIPIAVPALGVAQVHGDARRQRAIGHLAGGPEIEAQRARAEVEHDVVQRRSCAASEILEPLQVVLLGREPALAVEVAAERGGRSGVGRAEAAVLEGCEPELHAGASEADGRVRAADRGADQAVDGSLGLVLALPSRLVAGAHGPEGAHPTLIGVGAERAQQHPDAAHPVDQRVVHLDVDREAVVLEALDQVELPERPVQIELVRVEA